MKLDPDVISTIKVACFRMWPLKAAEKERAAWQQRTKAGRRIIREVKGGDKENYEVYV